MRYADTFGHHASLLPRDSTIETMQTILAAAPVRGFLPRVKWKDVDSDFAPLKQKLDWAAGEGVVLNFMLEHKTFDGTLPVPADLTKLCPANNTGGFTAALWHPIVRERYVALIDAIYAEFGSHLAFDGISIQESAPGLAAEVLQEHDYTVEGYADFYIDAFTAARFRGVGTLARPMKRIFFNQNYAPGKPNPIDLVLEKAIAQGLDNFVLTGPDTWLDDKGLLDKAYPRYTAIGGFVPTAAGISIPSFQKGFTVDEIYTFAREKLHASSFYWVYSPRYFPLAIPYIERDGRG